ncbi:peptidoglycan-binding protein [Oceanobacillus saliphilus]|uniref:peptidoglycan-binding protein n=1 Tax=Oceanobacillus saliphilus TaxID=2925834 RepID=UPI00201E1C1A|nr:peptidoglycan-binding protein [Oceanobacillus saliphilus]
MKSIIAIVLLALSLVHFSPQTAIANEEEKYQEKNSETEEVIEEVESTEQSEEDSDTTSDIAEKENENGESSDPSSDQVDINQGEPESNGLEEGSSEDASSEDKDEEVTPSEDEEETLVESKAVTVKSVQEPYADGDSGQHIVELKKDLVRLGFANWSNPSPFYGSNTAAVVEDFQDYYDLPVTGIADNTTRNKISQVLNPPYRVGDRGEPVVSLKEDLVELGFATWSNPSQFYGSNTKRVVEDFQKAHGLTADGIAGANTLAAIEKALTQSPLYSDGDSGQHIVELKKDLVRLGFVNWSNPSPFYGSNTAAVVEDFQDYYDLPVTGIADNTTRNKISQVLNPPYRVGDRGEPVVSLKEDLVELGFATWSNPSQFYGSNTARVVKDFQGAHSLTVDGIAGANTLAAIEKALIDSKLYRDGDSGQHIVELKEDLVRLGFASWSNPSQFYGSVTAEVVKDFQNYYKLPATGTADETTRAKIAQVLNPPYKNGDRGEPVIELKEKLVRLGFASWSNPSQIYGSVTRNVVRDFQEYYGLKNDGIADQATLNKMDNVISSAYKNGDNGAHITRLKEGLTLLGFANWSNPTSAYGNVTESVVKEFQKAYGLKVTGLVDEVTLNKLETEVEKEISKTKVTYDKYDLTLQEALNIQMAITNPPPQTDKYRNSPAYISSSYVELIETGAIYSGGKVKVRTEPRLVNSTHKYTLDPGTSVTIEGVVNGDSYQGSTEWYEITYKGETLYAHTFLVNPLATVAVTTARLNVRAEPNSKSDTHIYGILPIGTEVNVVAQNGSWYEISYNTWRNATRSDTEVHLNPENNDTFQHLDLSSGAGASASELNQFLDKKGTLDGLGQAFIEASKTHKVNELYLISHALLETANGTSKLATGIVVNGTKVYNMFGINAFDHCPQTCGSQFAYEQGWDTPYKAIVGGAKFIGERYIHNENQQNTIYKMRWNPNAMEATGKHGKQYATDIGWASKQIPNLKNMYNVLDNPLFNFNFVQYK